MKKIFTVLLAVLIVMSMPLAASAEYSTTLTTTVPDATYTLNVPADQEIPFGATSTKIGTIQVTDSSGFARGKNLEVTLTYDVFRSEEVETTIPFFIAYGTSEEVVEKGTISSGQSIEFVGTANGTVAPFCTKSWATSNYNVDEYYVSIDSEVWGKALGGNYSATITFTAEVVVSE